LNPLGLREKLEPPVEPLLTHLHTIYIAFYGCLPTRLNPLAERACFSQLTAACSCTALPVFGSTARTRGWHAKLGARRIRTQKLLAPRAPDPNPPTVTGLAGGGCWLGLRAPR
jgi:hypothetical protein